MTDTMNRIYIQILGLQSGEKGIGLGLAILAAAIYEVARAMRDK